LQAHPGTDRLEVVNSRDGTIQESKALSGHPLLVRSARETIARRRYQFAVLNGEPVEVTAEIDVNFALAESSAWSGGVMI
jgi:DNA/RNA endonuclease YhcR with UshA esterase domain